MKMKLQHFRPVVESLSSALDCKDTERNVSWLKREVFAIIELHTNRKSTMITKSISIANITDRENRVSSFGSRQSGRT